MEKQFVYYLHDKAVQEPVSLDKLLAVLQRRLQRKGPGPFRITKDGTKLPRELDEEQVLAVLRKRLEKGTVGVNWRVRNGAGDVIFRCREVMPAVQVIDTSGNPKADRFWSYVVSLFPDYHPRFAGAYVCKPNSQHRFGNAVDIFFDSLSQQDEVAAWAVKQASFLNIEHVISRDKIWNPEVGWHPYTGIYHAHIHVDFAPNFDQSLPCGVRG